MWRCRCGEINLNKATRCRDCEGPRSTHEDRDYEPSPRERRKTVYMGFFGMGMGDQREAPRRILTETELDSYYRESHRRARLQWLLYIAMALFAAGILAWQILRQD